MDQFYRLEDLLLPPPWPAAWLADCYGIRLAGPETFPGATRNPFARRPTHRLVADRVDWQSTRCPEAGR